MIKCNITQYKICVCSLNEFQRSPPTNHFSSIIWKKTSKCVSLSLFFLMVKQFRSPEHLACNSPSFLIFHPNNSWDNCQSRCQNKIPLRQHLTTFGLPVRVPWLPITSWNHSFCLFPLCFYFRVNNLNHPVTLTKKIFLKPTPWNSGLHFRASALFPYP